MSNLITGYVWKFEPEVKGTALLTLLAIADHTDQDGIAFPGLKLIATKIRKSQQTARKCIQRLEAAHKLIVKREKGKVNFYGVPAPGIAHDYETLCKKLGVEPTEFQSLKKDKRGTNLIPLKNSKGVNGANQPLKNSFVPPQEFLGTPLKNSWDEPSLTIINRHIPADADGEAEIESQSETPTAVEPEQNIPVQESTDAQESPAIETSSSAPRPRDLIWELICLGSFGKHYSDIGAQAGRVGRIKKHLLKERPDLAPDELEAAYRYYAKQNPDVLRTPSKRMKSPLTILDWIQQALDAGEIKKSDAEIRASAAWQAHGKEYEIYAAAFPEKTAQQILNENIAGILTYVQMQEGVR